MCFVTLRVGLSDVVIAASLSGGGSVSSYSVSERGSVSNFQFGSLCFDPVSYAETTELSQLARGFLF